MKKVEGSWGVDRDSTLNSAALISLIYVSFYSKKSVENWKTLGTANAADSYEYKNIRLLFRDNLP